MEAEIIVLIVFQVIGMTMDLMGITGIQCVVVGVHGIEEGIRKGEDRVRMS